MVENTLTIGVYGKIEPKKKPQQQMMNTSSMGFGVDQQQLHILSNAQDNLNNDPSKDKSNVSKSSLKSLSIGGNQAFVDIQNEKGEPVEGISSAREL